MSTKPPAEEIEHESTSKFVDRFVIEYLKDLRPSAAARRAGSTSPRVNQRAYALLQRPDVQERIERALAERNARTRIEADEVLRDVIAIAKADANEIVQVRRGCCRHCHGVEHRYQYVTQRELKKAERDHLASEIGLVEDFEHGGVGFDPKLDPHGECPHCGGEGSAYVHVNDTRSLSPAARALYAGAKQTKDGIEVKLHDKTKHTELLMRHLGLLVDKSEVKVVGELAERIVAGRKRSGVA